jgi:hypothetical protein
MTEQIPEYAVDFRERPACPCLAEWLPVYEAELQRRGLLSGPLPIMQLIGFADASNGVHSKGGAADLAHTTDEAIAVARQMGADAAWHRPANFDGQGAPEHDHMVLRGCPHNGPARYQIPAVDKGFNGLGDLGMGGKDDGPRPLSKRTWRQGIKWAKEQGDWLDMATEKEIRQLLKEEVRAPLRETMKRIAANQRARVKSQHAELSKGLAELDTMVTDDASKAQVDRLRAMLKGFDKDLTAEASAFEGDDA